MISAVVSPLRLKSKRLWIFGTATTIARYRVINVVERDMREAETSGSAEGLPYSYC